MSYKCECPMAGYCERHKTQKSARDVELCQGINCTPSQQAKYQVFWDQRAETPPTGKAHVTTAPGVKIVLEKFDPVPREEWPLSARSIAALAAETDRGVGDTIKRQLGFAGKLFEATVYALTGSNCKGCGFRQSKWNQLYPYAATPVTATMADR